MRIIQPWHRPGLRVLLASIAAAMLTLGAAGALFALEARSPATASGTSGAPQQLEDEIPPSLPCIAEPTPAQTEGPYYTPNSPQRASLLEDGSSGTRLVVTGQVLDTSCRPVAGALLDFWQADATGQYDNRGYQLRGHQYADEDGRYQLETIVPGLYPGRTSHIHVRLQAPGGPVLITQLYLPDEPRNSRDGIFDPRLVLQDLQQDENGVLTARFTFVLAAR